MFEAVIAENTSEDEPVQLSSWLSMRWIMNVHDFSVITILFSQFKHLRSSKVVYPTVPKETQPLGDHSPFLLHWEFFQSICSTVGHLMMNVDGTAGVMLKRNLLINICMKILGISKTEKLEGQRKNDILKWYLVGLTFKMTKTLRGGKRRVYRTTDTSVSASEKVFLNKEGEEIAVVVWMNKPTDPQFYS